MTQNNESPAQALTQLLTQCERLCEHGRSVLAKHEIKHGAFIFRSLGDTVNQLEVILRMIEKESSGDEKSEAGGLFSRITRSLRSKKEADEPTEEQPPAELNLSHNSLEGTSWTIPLSELLGFLAFGRKSGVLFVDAQEENFLIGLHEGNLVHATSDRTPEGLRLGEILVGYGYLTRRQLERFLRMADNLNEDVSGQALLDAGMISDDELRNALVHQAQQLFHRLVGTRNAVFRFREGMEVSMAFQVQLNTTQLLLESARYNDENTGAAKAARRDSWDDWNQEILSELTDLATIMPEAQVFQEGDPAAATEQNPEQSGELNHLVQTLQGDLSGLEEAPAGPDSPDKAKAEHKDSDGKNAKDGKEPQAPLPNEEQGKAKDGEKKDKAEKTATGAKGEKSAEKKADHDKKK